MKTCEAQENLESLKKINSLTLDACNKGNKKACSVLKKLYPLDDIVGILNDVKTIKDLEDIKTVFNNTVKYYIVSNPNLYKYNKITEKFNALYTLYKDVFVNPKKFEKRVRDSRIKLEKRYLVDGKKASDASIKFKTRNEQFLFVIKTETDTFYNEDLDKQYQQVPKGIDFKAVKKELEENAKKARLEEKIRDLE